MLLVLIVAAPLIPADRRWVVVEVIFDLILLAGIHSVGLSRHRWPFLGLTAVTLAVRWGELLSDTNSLDITALALTVVWICYALSIIVASLFRQRDVTLNTIMGAVVTYLLVAVGFSMLFQLLELRDPGSFSGLPAMVHQDRAELQGWMLYFSLVSITTIGYGDVVPVSELARPIAVMEGVFGQLYLAVMIARLVGLHLSSERES